MNTHIYIQDDTGTMAESCAIGLVFNTLDRIAMILPQSVGVLHVGVRSCPPTFFRNGTGVLEKLMLNFDGFIALAIHVKTVLDGHRRHLLLAQQNQSRSSSGLKLQPSQNVFFE